LQAEASQCRLASDAIGASLSALSRTKNGKGKAALNTQNANEAKKHYQQMGREFSSMPIDDRMLKGKST